MTKTIVKITDKVNDRKKRILSGKSPIITVKITSNAIVLKIPVAIGK